MTRWCRLPTEVERSVAPARGRHDQHISCRCTDGQIIDECDVRRDPAHCNATRTCVCVRLHREFNTSALVRQQLQSILPVSELLVALRVALHSIVHRCESSQRRVRPRGHRADTSEAAHSSPPLPQVPPSVLTPRIRFSPSPQSRLPVSLPCSRISAAVARRLARRPWMSFAGYGPLGAFGWGTTTAQALDTQASLVVEAAEATVRLLPGATAVGGSQQAAGGGSWVPFPSLQWGICSAAAPTCSTSARPRRRRCSPRLCSPPTRRRTGLRRSASPCTTARGSSPTSRRTSRTARGSSRRPPSPLSSAATPPWTRCRPRKRPSSCRRPSGCPRWR